MRKQENLTVLAKPTSLSVKLVIDLNFTNRELNTLSWGCQFSLKTVL